MRKRQAPGRRPRSRWRARFRTARVRKPSDLALEDEGIEVHDEVAEAPGPGDSSGKLWRCSFTFSPARRTRSRRAVRQRLLPLGLRHLPADEDALAAVLVVGLDARARRGASRTKLGEVDRLALRSVVPSSRTRRVQGTWARDGLCAPASVKRACSVVVGERRRRSPSCGSGLQRNGIHDHDRARRGPRAEAAAARRPARGTRSRAAACRRCRWPCPRAAGVPPSKVRWRGSHTSDG